MLANKARSSPLPPFNCLIVRPGGGVSHPPDQPEPPPMPDVLHPLDRLLSDYGMIHELTQTSLRRWRSEAVCFVLRD